jgi:hypothetical protein
MIPRYQFRSSKRLTFALVFGVLVLAGCTRKDPRSEIVERAQQAGAGDVDSASAFSIEDWMRKHKDVAVQLNTMCAPIREKAQANWGDSTAGKVCIVARNAAMSTYKYPSDDKTFHSGLSSSRPKGEVCVDDENLQIQVDSFSSTDNSCMSLSVAARWAASAESDPRSIQESEDHVDHEYLAIREYAFRHLGDDRIRLERRRHAS